MTSTLGLVGNEYAGSGQKPTTRHLAMRHFESAIALHRGPNAFHARLFLLAASYEARIMTAPPCLLG